MADSDSRSGARYNTKAIIDYVNRVHAGHDAALAQAFAVPQHMPAIQVGPSEGRLLYLLAKLVSATKIVEVGTLAGYSAIHMARALPAGGHLWSIEYEASHAEDARANIAAAGLEDPVTGHVEAGRVVVPTHASYRTFTTGFIAPHKVYHHHHD